MSLFVCLLVCLFVCLLVSLFVVCLFVFTPGDKEFETYLNT